MQGLVAGRELGRVTPLRKVLQRSRRKKTEEAVYSEQ